MCGGFQDVPEEKADAEQPKVEFFDGSVPDPDTDVRLSTDEDPEAASEIKQALGDLLGELAGFLLGPDPESVDAYLLSNRKTGQRGFEYSPTGIENGQDPTIIFEEFTTPRGETVAAVKFDAKSILIAQDQIAADPQFQAAGAPSGALLFTSPQLLALASIAGEFAERVQAANEATDADKDPESEGAELVGAAA